MNTPEHTDIDKQDPVYRGLGIRLCIALLIVLLFGAAITGFALYASSQERLASETRERQKFLYLNDTIGNDRKIALEALRVNPQRINLETMECIRNGVINTDSLGVETGVLVWCRIDSRNAGAVREYDRLEIRPEILRSGNTLLTVPEGANYCELRVVSPKPPLAVLDR